jgi:hypothetical protein
VTARRRIGSALSCVPRGGKCARERSGLWRRCLRRQAPDQPGIFHPHDFACGVDAHMGIAPLQVVPIELRVAGQARNNVTAGAPLEWQIGCGGVKNTCRGRVLCGRTGFLAPARFIQHRAFAYSCTKHGDEKDETHDFYNFNHRYTPRRIGATDDASGRPQSPSCRRLRLPASLMCTSHGNSPNGYVSATERAFLRVWTYCTT